MGLSVQKSGIRIKPKDRFIMDFDEDAPPELVDTTVGDDGLEEVTTKVPITIVTGDSESFVLLSAKDRH